MVSSHGKFYLIFFVLLLFLIGIAIEYPEKVMPARVRLVLMDSIDDTWPRGGCFAFKYCQKLMLSFAAKDVPLLVEHLHLKSNPEEIDHKISFALANLGEVAHPALITLLSSREMHVRLASAATLLRLDQIPPGAIDPLIKALVEDQQEIYAIALGRCGSTAAKAVPYLIEFLDVGGYMTMDAIMNIGPAAYEDLILALRSSRPKIREGAAKILGTIGPEVSFTIPHLMQAFDDSVQANDPTMVCLTAIAIASIGTDDDTAIPILQTVFQCKTTSDVRRAAHKNIQLLKALAKE